ncbi:MAG: hypothetical protein ABII93_01455 [Chrysiogenia bacterium]
MNLMLLRYARYRLALDMRRVARVQPLAKDGHDDTHWLLDPGPARIELLLTNGRILPVSEIETTIDCSEPLAEANPFFRGCSRSPVVSGFAIVGERVYGVLSDQFLTEEPNRGEHEPV